MTKKKKELQPEIKTIGNQEVNTDLVNLAKELKESTYVDTSEEESSDSFFKSVLNKLFDEKNVSSKTEYLNVKENFVGSKLEFFASFGNMPYLKNFIEIFEIKRISLERKGRKEILMGLQERRQEIEQQRNENLRGMFNV